jgi:parvulin-like peptidyl-prolyl isomerase
VKTQFGYHIIRLDETREQTFPEYEQVKPKLKERVSQLIQAKAARSVATKGEDISMGRGMIACVEQDASRAEFLL